MVMADMHEVDITIEAVDIMVPEVGVGAAVGLDQDYMAEYSLVRVFYI
jgi:hypothetical protein